MRRHPASNENGFTMIEVIVSLILIGIMAVIAGMGLVAITKGYVFSRQNNETSLKAQVAMAKMVKEIGTQSIATNTIKTIGNTSITFNYTDPTNTALNHTIVLSGTQILFDTIPLINNVNSFTLSYYTAAGSTTVTLPDIRRVDIELKLNSADNIVATFRNSAKVQETYY